MLIVSGSLTVAAGARDGYVAACRTVVEQARRTDGCLDFALSADPLDDARINVYERWESDAALEAFRGSGPEPAGLGPLRAAEVARYQVASVGPA